MISNCQVPISSNWMVPLRAIIFVLSLNFPVLKYNQRRIQNRSSEFFKSLGKEILSGELKERKSEKRTGKGIVSGGFDFVDGFLREKLFSGERRERETRESNRQTVETVESWSRLR